MTIDKGSKLIRLYLRSSCIPSHRLEKTARDIKAPSQRLHSLVVPTSTDKPSQKDGLVEKNALRRGNVER